ncbi:MAG: leucine-rich repeat protein [Butyrivibrio sp.]|nr:leucine-rich repeat protein [Butyrivibrio sp.]
MAEKMSMDILIKDMKEQDARIEADIRTYAALLGNVEKHTRDLKKRKEEKEMLEQFLHRIGKERASSDDSVHIQTLEDLISAQEREIADNNRLIEEQKAYYEALSEKDYQALWEQKEDKGAIAAICFAFEKWEHFSESMVRKLAGTRNQLSEEVARYLLEKALVYSESKQEADDEAEEVDGLLRDILGRTHISGRADISDGTDLSQSDAVWQNIEECLRIRKTQRTMIKCKTALQFRKERKSRFETFEKDYADNYREILAEIKGLEKQKIGKEVDAAVKGTKEWFSEQTAELEKQIKRRRNEAAIIENHLQTLQSIHTELENGMESGLEPERCDAICNTIKTMQGELAEIVDVKELDYKRRQMLKDYQEHLKTIKAAKDAEVEREKENKRQRVQAKVDRKRKFKKALPFLAAGVVLLIFYMYCGRNVYHGTGKIYFGNGRFKNYKVAEGVEEIPSGLFEGNESMESITLPESLTEIGSSAFEGCTSLKEIVIPESVTEIGSSAFEDCTSLKEIVIPESVTEIGWSAFKDCTSLESVEMHGSTLSLGGSIFKNCGFLKEIKNAGNIEDFEELLKGGDNVSNCCNLDMSEVYDNLYSSAINGVPLLENEVQLKNLLDCRDIPHGEELTIEFDPAYDILTDAEFGAEKTDGDGRSVDFSFRMKHKGMMYTYEGMASSGSESSNIEVELYCTDININELLNQLSAGDENAILEMLSGQTVAINDYNVVMNKDEIIVLESELIEESEEEENEAEESGAEYSILLKLKINKPIGEITLLGSLRLSEQKAFVPKLFLFNEAVDIDFSGSYAYAPTDNEEPIFTIDKQYEKCYSVTMNGEKQLLVMDIATESSGKLISMTDEGDYNIESISLSTDMAGIDIDGRKYYKTGSGVSDTMPEDITPFAGVWQGTYYAARDPGRVANSRRYILPVGENVLAVVSDFGPMKGRDDFDFGTTLDILNYDPQSGSCTIESKDWLEHPDKYFFISFEGKVNDSYDIISGDSGEYPFTISKTEPDNTTGMAADADSWSIYDASGNVKKNLLEEFLMKNIPEDAFKWNGSSYCLYTGFETWEEAKAYCESLGGHLAIIESVEENEAVYSWIRERGYKNAFFGASDAAEEGVWRWVDGSVMSYTNWHSGEPNNDGDEDYIDYYFGDGTWNDGDFGEYGTNIVICEWD